MLSAKKVNTIIFQPAAQLKKHVYLIPPVICNFKAVLNSENI